MAFDFETSFSKTIIISKLRPIVENLVEPMKNDFY
jgi:hypothetical protein